uniref:Solute carrier family 40 protein n=1 Tax=Macrostomum lignano TaxID=282301 RepID=A0A1I8HP65_9PLAT
MCIIRMQFTWRKPLPTNLQRFGYTSSEAGTYIGMILAALHMGRMLGCYIWTPLLKRFGTAPILCSSLPLLALAALLFGCSAGFLSAAFAILACGLVNALTPVVRHCLAESAASGADALDQSSNARLAEQHWLVSWMPDWPADHRLFSRFINASSSFDLADSNNYKLIIIVFIVFFDLAAIIAVLLRRRFGVLRRSRGRCRRRIIIYLSCGGGRGAGSASPAAPGCSRQQQQQQQENSNDDRLNDSIGSDSVELFLTGRVGVSSRGGATAGFALVAEALVNSTNSNLWLSALLGAVAHLSSELGFHSFGGGSMGSARMTKTRLLALLAIFLLSFAIGYQRVLVLAWSATDSELGGLGFETGELTGLLCISAATQLLATVGIAVCGARNTAENLFCRINFDQACSTRPNQRSRHGLQFTGSPVCSNGRW